jgi:uncharacterized protein YukJ
MTRHHPPGPHKRTNKGTNKEARAGPQHGRRGVPAYGVLKGTVVGSKPDGGAPEEHFEIWVKAAGVDYRFAVNVRSQTAPVDVLYLVNQDFHHPLTAALTDLPVGYTSLQGVRDAPAVDYIRGNLFDATAMRVLPSGLGAHNPLSDLIASYVDRARRDPAGEDGAAGGGGSGRGAAGRGAAGPVIYAFGSRWGPEVTKRDQYFRFRPGNGIHDIHMNQGNPHAQGKHDFFNDNGVWQDGAVFLHFPDVDQWVAIFLAFASQVWHTDDETGAPLIEQAAPAPARVGAATYLAPSGADLSVRIVAARLEPPTITLLNASPSGVNLQGWALADVAAHNVPLDGALASGETRAIALPAGVTLSKDGGVVTVLNDHGLKVDGASYTADDMQHAGWTHVFRS